MDFEPSDKVKHLEAQVRNFMEHEIYPAEAVFERQLNGAPSRWQIPPVLEEVKRKARAAGLWNLFLPESELGAGLTNLEYAPLCEIMGRSPIGPEAFNCSAPDTGNMETLVRYATNEQQERWLKPLLDGEIRSSTDPDAPRNRAGCSAIAASRPIARPTAALASMSRSARSRRAASRTTGGSSMSSSTQPGPGDPAAGQPGLAG
jgi:acyl-CoA dehydrogenase